ncbi:MAG: type II toxin-antitoxin system PemK/MazF family toxin [Chitinophagales bacterium]|nr:type II toxin-antitoxin system PemK/MazF family toxin [Chitinophagales bacterium]
MAKYLQGDIVIVNFPFTDHEGSKPRPAIVVSNSRVNKSTDVILAAITTTLLNDDFSYPINKKKLTTPLHNEFCEVRCHKLFLAEKSIIIKKISALKKVHHQDLYNIINSAIEVI